MKVFNLRCHNGHGFEGWFGSEDDFLAQNGDGLIECPLCADKVIVRLPSAPRLNLSPSPAPREEPAAPTPVASTATDLQTQWLQAVRHVLAHTEDVGERFADEARRIHYGEIGHRGIRGQATPSEREALRDEGIEVMPLPVPAALKGTLQ